VAPVIPYPILKVWDETGSTGLAVLGGYQSVTISEVLSGEGSLQLEVPRSSVGAEHLDVDEDRQLSVTIPYEGGAVTSWWVLDDDASTWISDDPATETLRITGRGLSALLDDALVPPSGGVGTTPAEWAWAAETPGKIVTDLVTSAQARGLLQGVTVSGTATVDASGVAWPTTVTVTHKAGATLSSVVKALVEARLLETRWDGRELELHRWAGGLERHQPVMLRPGRDVTSAPVARSRKAVATAVLVLGAADATARRTQALTGRRAREAFVSESKAASGVLDSLGDLYLGAHGAADVQLTHEVTDAADGSRPWVDYRPGDWILTRAAGLQVVERRVSQIALSVSGSGGVKATLELGSIMKTWEERMSAQIDRLLPGDGVVT
jgi:hypothetical protein